jgi:hypothetical protein
MKLPRFQFRLRTLMIVVTLLAVPMSYVGWQAKIVRERTVWLKTHAAREPVDDDVFFLEIGWVIFRDSDSEQHAPSRIRLWLGDEARRVILVLPEAPSTDAAEAAALFPEATIYKYRPLQPARFQRIIRRHDGRLIHVLPPSVQRRATNP